MSINRGMDKEDIVHIYMEYYSAIKKQWNNVICTKTHGPRDCLLSEVSQRKTSYNITYMCNLKNVTNEPIYNPEIVTDVENKFMVMVGRRKG